MTYLEKVEQDWKNLEAEVLEGEEVNHHDDNWDIPAPTAADERWWSKVIAGEIQQGRRCG